MMDDGFVGRYEVVEPRRGNRRWPDDVKVLIATDGLDAPPTDIAMCQDGDA